MKKKKLLSLLTGIAIVVSTAGTYAIWDKVSDSTNSADVTFSKPVTVNYSGANFVLNKDDTLATSDDSKNPSANAQNIQFSVSNPDAKADTLQIIPQVNYKNSSDGDTTTNLANDFDINITETSGATELKTKTASTNDANGILTESIGDTTSEKDGKITPTYSVTITPKDSTLAGKDLTVKLTAQLSKSAQS